jgi:N-acetylglucosaminyldiphosphoundecaprenol N-acetyl-beta-D-mannosaminyltransferase
LGLPIDVVTMQDVVERIHAAANSREKCFISTPNLNFLVNARKDPSFRASVLQSDLSVVDGISLLSAARLMGVRLPGRISGADMFMALREFPTHKPLKVFFLGGPPGAAKRAHDVVNQENKGVVCVGHDDAGFGDIESMSSDTLIDKINRCQPDFVVVSLGAIKGQAWIMRNRHRLEAPVISHLGAVVNFTAGTVQRAPRWMQRFGLEWLWRASTEQGLYKRYRDDALVLVKLLLNTYLLAAAKERVHLAQRHGQADIITQDADTLQSIHRMVLSGHLGRGQTAILSNELHKYAVCKRIEIDASRLTWLDPYALGTMIRRHGELLNQGGDGLRIHSASTSLRQHLTQHEACYLLG